MVAHFTPTEYFLIASAASCVTWSLVSSRYSSPYDDLLDSVERMTDSTGRSIVARVFAHQVVVLEVNVEIPNKVDVRYAEQGCRCADRWVSRSATCGSKAGRQAYG